MPLKGRAFLQTFAHIILSVQNAFEVISEFVKESIRILCLSNPLKSGASFCKYVIQIGFQLRGVWLHYNSLFIDSSFQCMQCRIDQPLQSATSDLGLHSHHTV